MNQNVNKILSGERNSRCANLADGTRKESFLPNNIDRKSTELQQEQTRYLKRILEACCDCV